MIAEISPPTANIQHALNYNFLKVEESVADLIYVKGLKQDFNGDIDLNSALSLMQERLLGSRTRNPVFHVSLNPHPNDILNNDDLQHIACEYMQRMGYGKQPFIVFKHRDTGRIHLHIVSIRVDETGKKIDHRFERIKSQKVVSQLEDEFSLIKTPKRMMKKKVIPLLMKVDFTRGNIHEQMISTIRAVFEHYSFSSIGELDAILHYYGLSAKAGKIKLGTKTFATATYLAINDKGKPISPPLTGKELGQGFSIRDLNQKMMKSKSELKGQTKELRRAIMLLLEGKRRTREQFEKKLAEIGVFVHIRQNKERIYGITFINQREGYAINGSSIDRDLTANFFNDYFLSPPESNDPELEKYTKYAQTIEDQSLIPELLNAGKAVDYKEQAWQRKLKRAAV